MIHSYMLDTIHKPWRWLVGFLMICLSPSVLSQSILIGQQTFRFLPNHAYQIVTDSTQSSSHGSAANQAIRRIEITEQPRAEPLAATIDNTDRESQARYDCGLCQVLVDQQSGLHYIVHPYFLLSLRSGIVVADLQAQLNQMDHIKIVNLNQYQAVIQLLDKSAWLEVYQQLNQLQHLVQYVRPDITSQLDRPN